MNYIRVKVFKNEPSKISGRQPLKNLKDYGLLSTGCLPQILLSPFLNTLSHRSIKVKGKPFQKDKRI